MIVKIVLMLTKNYCNFSFYFRFVQWMITIKKLLLSAEKIIIMVSWLKMLSISSLIHHDTFPLISWSLPIRWVLFRHPKNNGFIPILLGCFLGGVLCAAPPSPETPEIHLDSFFISDFFFYFIHYFSSTCFCLSKLFLFH